MRSRACDSPPAAYGGRGCLLSDGSGNRGKEESETKKCKDKTCPVNGNWGEWSDYTDCSKTCGGGEQSRARSCTNPPAAFGGLDCLLSDGSGNRAKVESEDKKCNEQACQGEWGEWSDFTECSATCGEGVQTRSRSCSGDLGCLLSDGSGNLGKEESETKVCSNKPCQVDGGYSEWSLPSECSVTCGDGVRTRQRTCTNPAPKNGGKDCTDLGPDVEFVPCNMGECPPSECDEEDNEFCGMYSANTAYYCRHPWVKVNCKRMCGMCLNP